MTEATIVSHEQPGLFANPDGEQLAPTHRLGISSSARPDAIASYTGNERAERTRGSMLWAAYGDALGFVSELVDRHGLERRTQGAPLNHLMAWERRVGGRLGIDTVLPGWVLVR